MHLPRKIEKLANLPKNTQFSRKIVVECRRIYRDFIVERFKKETKGSHWKALKKSTLAARRRRGNNSRDKLVDTGELLNNLHSLVDITLLRQDKKHTGLAIGFGGRGKTHSKWVKKNGKYTKAKSDITIKQIAEWHQHGTSKMPQRKILVRADKETTELLRQAILKIIQQEIE